MEILKPTGTSKKEIIKDLENTIEFMFENEISYLIKENWALRISNTKDFSGGETTLEIMFIPVYSRVSMKRKGGIEEIALTQTLQSEKESLEEMLKNAISEEDYHLAKKLQDMSLRGAENLMRNQLITRMTCILYVLNTSTT